MNIYGFIGEYCQDLIQAHDNAKNLIELADYPHDEIITDSTGKSVPVVYIDGTGVPVSDFFTYQKEDFVDMYKKLPSAGIMYDNYLDSFVVIEGEEVLNHIRNQVKRDAARLDEECELIPATW